ncbi:MAG: preprotein translocase subunit SecA [Clostridia bacterium]|nr:preprotein translocase subunit SecA [Clostridia bacterium]
MSFLKNLLTPGPERLLKPIYKQVDAIDALESVYEKLTDAQIREKTAEFKARAQGGESLDQLLPEAFALVREGSKRVLGMRPFRVQMVGGIVLHQGRIAEMKTGEGKTLTAVLPAYLNALTGKGVHIVTVNDYLAKFQGEEMGKLYRYLGLTVGIILTGMTPEQRRAAYACDVTYGTNNELGFDYLRDNMVVYKDHMVQRGHSFAIVDEVDSILIDEARTPLIISGQGEKSTDMYERADRFVCRLEKGERKDLSEDKASAAVRRMMGEEDIEVSGDYYIDEKDKAANLTEQGIEKAEKYFGVENLSDPENNELYHHIIQALKANAIMKRDVDYVVQDNQVMIVDEFTGRIMVGRRFSDGLHQALEAKEHVKVERESRTLATITYQNFFRMYTKLSGMTGTAKTEEDEFQGIYSLDVVQIPTNRPMIRQDMNDMVYTTKKGKYKAVVEEIIRRHATGQPLLVGTISVEVSELLSRMLELRGVPHEVLNAKQHAREAAIVAQAGHFGAVTIATNMAGRGTDILLGGNPDFMARRQMRQEEFSDELIELATGHNEDVDEEVLAARRRFNELRSEYKKTTDAEHERVVAVGGLHIIGTERHESRRIDNQLRGRAGRQGDPGSSQFFISMEDDLLRVFGGDRMKLISARLGMDEDTPMDAKILTGQIENAQKRMESRNFETRKHVLQYDDVMNQQRELIYKQRRQVLEGENVHDNIVNMIKELIASAVDRECADENSANWDMAGLADYLCRLCVPQEAILPRQDELIKMGKDKMKEDLTKIALSLYVRREELITAAGHDMRELERAFLLHSVDRRWMDHIDAMDQLRDGIGLRAYAQRDPINEYKMESYDMFESMVNLIREDTVRMTFLAHVADRNAPQPQRKAVGTVTGTNDVKNSSGMEKAADASRKAGAQPVKVDKKPGRNDPCPCGSGKKYKNCCGRNVQ